MTHQYIERATGEVKDEVPFADAIVKLVYNDNREKGTLLFRAATSARMSSLLGYLNFDMPLGARLTGGTHFLSRMGISFEELYDPPSSLRTARQVFERRIRFWERRPMNDDPDALVSPGDGKVIIGSFSETSQLLIKEKFFSFYELFGAGKAQWRHIFEGGDFAVVRLTPEKYHYNHSPVAGKVIDHYTIDGRYHSCNPSAVVAVATPYSKNKRVVTIIDTDVPDGSHVGKVAMIEVVALMIGDVDQRYSAYKYDNPVKVTPGLFMKKGAVKSLYRPGSSTDIVVFESGRTAFEPDLVKNRLRPGVASRFSLGFGQNLVETEIDVRETIARRILL